jgi:hypothetical protein
MFLTFLSTGDEAGLHPAPSSKAVALTSDRLLISGISSRARVRAFDPGDSLVLTTLRDDAYAVYGQKLASTRCFFEPLMLHRPPSSPAAARARRAARQRRWRQRRRNGVMAVTVEIDSVGIDWLIKVARCLDERDAQDPREIGAAISRSIAVSSRN